MDMTAGVENGLWPATQHILLLQRFINLHFSGSNEVLGPVKLIFIPQTQSGLSYSGKICTRRRVKLGLLLIPAVLRRKHGTLRYPHMQLHTSIILLSQLSHLHVTC